jgi:hypothetical protein
MASPRNVDRRSVRPTAVGMTAILERGDVFFFYRPRVEREAAEDAGDVQRLLLVLEPDGEQRYRVIVVGRKRLPDPERHERAWALVAEVGRRSSELAEELGPKTYHTKTRGRRFQPGARPAGEGRYALVEHGGHTHLVYRLDQADAPGRIERELDVRRQASFVVAVRNPEAPAPPGTGLDPERRARLPQHLQERFAGRRFAPVDPPEFLDHEGVELVLIGAAEDVSRELGIDLGERIDRDVRSSSHSRT